MSYNTGIGVSGGIPMRNQKGMSLLEVMIAAGVLSGLLLAVSQLMTFSSKSMKNINLGTDWTNMVHSIQQVLNSEDACKATFAGTNFIPGPGVVAVSEIKVGTMVLAKTGFPPKGLKVTGITITDTGKAPVDMTYGATPVKRYFALLNLDAEKTEDAMGRINYKKSFVFTALVNGAGKIESCHGEFSSPRVCQDLGGVYDEATTPKCRISDLTVTNLTATNINTTDITATTSRSTKLIITGPPNSGGNVLYDCSWVNGTDSLPAGPGSHHRFTNCPPDKFPVSGSLHCPVGFNYSATHIHSTPDYGHGWGGTCVGDGPPGPPETRTVTVRALCCKM